MMRPLEVMARRDDWQDGIALYARQPNGDRFAAAKPIEFEVRQQGELVEPFVRISVQTAQQLMDELWQCGLRPTEGTGSAGSLRATERHLDDMRKIVGAKLNVAL